MTRQTACKCLAVLGAALLPLIHGNAAHAVVVNVGGMPYDVIAINGSYAANNLDFQIPSIGGRMPWWGNDMLAIDFAQQVYDQLGTGWSSSEGPVFAYAFDASTDTVQGIAQVLTNPALQSDVTPNSAAPVTYAIATTPAPGPLPALGAAAAFGWSRRLRRRLPTRVHHSATPL